MTSDFARCFFLGGRGNEHCKQQPSVRRNEDAILCDGRCLSRFYVRLFWIEGVVVIAQFRVATLQKLEGFRKIL